MALFYLLGEGLHICETMEPDLGKGLEALSGAKLRATAPGCRQKPVLEAEGNRFPEAEHSHHPEKLIQGELDPQKVDVYCKQEGGAKVTRLSPHCCFYLEVQSAGVARRMAARNNFQGARKGLS